MIFFILLILFLILVIDLFNSDFTNQSIFFSYVLKLSLFLFIAYQQKLTSAPIDNRVDNNINQGIQKIFSILDNDIENKSLCFIGGAIVFEDPNGDIFNLLTYEQSKLNDECYNINDKKLSKNVNLIQTLTHAEFSDRFMNTTCVPNNPSIIIPKPKCINNKFKCNKYERKINIPNICNKCVSNNQHVETKRSLLYYPFEDNNKKRFLYIKLESHPSISFGHIKNAIDTYITKTKFDKDSTTCKPRRERLKDRNTWDTSTKNDDKLLYDHLLNKKIIDDNDISLIEYYNNNIRVGNELFLPYSFISNYNIFTVSS